MVVLTPASPAGLPPLGELIADDPFWRYPAAALPGEGIAHLRVWLTARRGPGYLAVVTEPGLSSSVTQATGQIWAKLADRYGPSLVLLEHSPAPEADGGEEILDLALVGADGSSRRSRIWPTPEENPRHAELELWMALYGHQIVSKPASEFDQCEDEGD